MTDPPGYGGGPGHEPEPSAHYYNQPTRNPTTDRLATEVAPRLNAIADMESAALLGVAQFTVEEIAPSIILLAEKALQQVVIAEEERRLRGAA
jgi:hypothetical protein